MADLLFSKNRKLFDDSIIQRIERDGTEIEKGVIITEDYLIKNEKFFAEILNIFAAYPDLYLDMIKPQKQDYLGQQSVPIKDVQAKSGRCLFFLLRRKKELIIIYVLLEIIPYS